MTFLSTPFVGALTAANAVTPSITIIAPYYNQASYQDNGTNSLIHLEATVDNATGIAAVHFAVHNQTTGATTVLPNVTSAPWATNWNPASTGGSATYDITADALDSSNVVQLQTTRTNVVVNNTLQSTWLTYPSDGGQIGSFDCNGTCTPKIIVRGTTSTGTSTVGTNVFDFNTSTWGGNFSSTTAGGAGNPFVGTPAIDAQPASGTTTPVKIVNFNPFSGSNYTDNTITANVYPQTLPAANFTATPANQDVPLVSASATSAPYIVTALDQNGQPIAGVNVMISGATSLNVTKSGGAGTTSGTCATASCYLTDTNGQVVFTDHRTTAGTDTITVQSNLKNDGVYDNVNDVTRTVTFDAYSQTPSSLSISATPNQNLYASGSEYTSSTPVVTVLVKDQHNNPIPNTNISNLVYSVTRTITSGATSPGSIPNTTCGSGGLSCTTDSNGLITLPHNGTTSDQNGNDVYNAYLESDGTPGFQSGELAASPLQLNFASQTIQWSQCLASNNHYQGTFCATQAPADTVQTERFFNFDGTTPVAGRSMTIYSYANYVTHQYYSVFPTQQPAGSNQVNAYTVTCTTAADGSCGVNVDSPSNSFDYLFAVDNNTGASSILFISYRTGNLNLGWVYNENVYRITPFETLSSGDGNNISYNGILTGKPGDILLAEVQLNDVGGSSRPGPGYPVNPNSEQLANVAGTISVDHSKLVALPRNFNPLDWGFGSTPGYLDETTPGVVGSSIDANNLSLLNAGSSSMPFTSDNGGNVWFAIAIGRDAAFDNSGVVDVTPRITVNGSAVQLANPADPLGFADNIGPGHMSSSGDTWSTDYTAFANDYFGDCVYDQHAGTYPTNNCDLTSYYNAGPVTVTEDNGQSLTGNVPTTQTRTVDVWARDSYGNLTRTWGDIALTSSGVGTLSRNYADGGYLNAPDKITLTNDTPVNNTVPQDSGTAGNQTVTGQWNVYGAVWGQEGSNVVPQAEVPTNYCTSYCSTYNGTTELPPVNFNVANIDWYLQELNPANGATYTFSTIPTLSSDGAVPTGTTVTDQVTALDQFGQPITGLWIAWFNSANTANGGAPSDVTETNANGQASYSFVGTVQGVAQITGVVNDCVNGYNNSCNEVARGVTNVIFDSVPSISAPSHRVGPGWVTVSGTTRPGAVVDLYARAAGSSTYTWAASTTADPFSGGYAVSKVIYRSTAFYVRVDNAVNSAARGVNLYVAPRLTVTSPSYGRVVLGVTTNPAQPSGKVLFQRYYGGAWHEIGIWVLSSTGTKSLALSMPHGSIQYFRAYVYASTVGVLSNWANGGHYVTIKVS